MTWCFTPSQPVQLYQGKGAELTALRFQTWTEHQTSLDSLQGVTAYASMWTEGEAVATGPEVGAPDLNVTAARHHAQISEKGHLHSRKT